MRRKLFTHSSDEIVHHGTHLPLLAYEFVTAGLSDLMKVRELGRSVLAPTLDVFAIAEMRLKKLQYFMQNAAEWAVQLPLRIE